MVVQELPQMVRMGLELECSLTSPLPKAICLKVHDGHGWELRGDDFPTAKGSH